MTGQFVVDVLEMFSFLLRLVGLNIVDNEGLCVRKGQHVIFILNRGEFYMCNNHITKAGADPEVVWVIRWNPKTKMRTFKHQRFLTKTFLGYAKLRIISCYLLKMTVKKKTKTNVSC